VVKLGVTAVKDAILGAHKYICLYYQLLLIL